MADPADADLLATMSQREILLKKRLRAANMIDHESRRYRTMLVGIVALSTAVVVTAAYEALRPVTSPWWRGLLVIVVGIVLGGALGSALLHTERGQQLLRKRRLSGVRRYSGDLQAGRRWLNFYYRDEEISSYLPLVLYLIEGEQRFDSVADALAFAKDPLTIEDRARFEARARRLFDRIAAQTNLVAISSYDDGGRPSNRIMNFVRSDQPGVWYVTTAPAGAKITEFDRGPIALVTPPTESGGTISSNRVTIRRAEKSFRDVAELYRDQVPGYVDAMTDTDQMHEIVYELTMTSAKVETWFDHQVVTFPAAVQAIQDPQ